MSILELDPLRKDRKFMYSVTDVRYDDWGETMLSEVKTNEFIGEIQARRIDALAFDNMYRVI